MGFGFGFGFAFALGAGFSFGGVFGRPSLTLMTHPLVMSPRLIATHSTRPELLRMGFPFFPMMIADDDDDRLTAERPAARMCLTSTAARPERQMSAAQEHEVNSLSSNAAS
jgi:hypothetical protein